MQFEQGRSRFTNLADKKTMVDDESIVYVCDHVLSGDREIHVIVHHGDDNWQFTCGQHDHFVNGASIRPIHFEHVVSRNFYIVEVVQNIKRGWLAERTVGRWQLSAHDD